MQKCREFQSPIEFVYKLCEASLSINEKIWPLKKNALIQVCGSTHQQYVTDLRNSLVIKKMIGHFFEVEKRPFFQKLMIVSFDFIMQL